MTTFSLGWNESGDGQDPFALAVYNGYLYCFCQYGQLRLNSVNLSTALNQKDGTLSTTPSVFSGAWSTNPFVINSGYGTIHSQSPSAAAAAVVGSNLCLFWNDDSTGPMAAVCDASNLGTTILPWYTLQDFKKTPLGQNSQRSYDITVTALGSDAVLVAIQRDQGSSRVIWMGFYLLAQCIDPPQGSTGPGTWNAAGEWTITFDTLVGNSNITTSTINTSLHMDWYTIGVPSKPTDPPSSWLGFTLFDPTRATGYLCWLPFDYASAPLILIGGSQGGTIASPGSSYPIPGVTQPLHLLRAPGGSMRIYAVSKQSSSGSTTIVGYTQPGNRNPPALVPDASPLLNCVLPDGTSQLQPDLPLVVAFLVGPTAWPTVVTNDPLPNGNGNVSAYPVAEAIFAHTGGAIYYYSQPYGRLQQVPKLMMGNTTTCNILTVNGIFDGPFPMPAAQLAPYSGQPSFADVKYGRTSQTQTSRSRSVGVSVGLKSSGAATKGIGPAWDLSLSAGIAHLQTDSTAVEVVQDVVQSLGLDATDAHNVVANGTIFGTAMAFYSNVYRLLVPDPTNATGYVISPNASLWATIWAAPIGAEALLYEPYAVTPGDITSYTEEAWNAAMNRLGYPGWNYFNDVIVANAYTFPVLGTPYLEIPLAVATSPARAVDLTNSHFTEFSWTFDASLYAGISGGGGIDIFGMGEEEQWSMMAGFTVSTENDTSTDTTTTWGITVDQIYFPSVAQPAPPAPPAPPPAPVVGVNSFTVRLYLLPASQLWTQELLALVPSMQHQIDPNSQPWRIVYQVTSYTLTDGTQYPPAAPPSAPTTKPTLNQTNMKYGPMPGVWAMGEDGQNVHYAVAFANARGVSSLGPWSDPQLIPYPQTGSCPQLTIPTDTSTSPVTTKRLVYRKLDPNVVQLVKTIPDNSTTTIYDDDPAMNIIPRPGQGLVFGLGDPSTWGGRVNGQSAVWKVGNTVRYAVTFTFAENVPTNFPQGWLLESELSVSTPGVQIGTNCYPELVNIPLFPDRPNLPTCTGRNIYRTIIPGQSGDVGERNVLVGHISNNTDTTFLDMTN